MQTIIEDYLRMFICLVDGCHHYQNLTDAERKNDHETKGNGQCDDELHDKGWYRFQGAAGTKMQLNLQGLKNVVRLTLPG